MMMKSNTGATIDTIYAVMAHSSLTDSGYYIGVMHDNGKTIRTQHFEEWSTFVAWLTLFPRDYNLIIRTWPLGQRPIYRRACSGCGMDLPPHVNDCAGDMHHSMKRP
jgi:hypothetical protein